MNKTVLVTGASGFIAGHCILDLLNAGYNVRGTVRDLSRAAAIRETLARHNARAADIEFMTADLMDAASWREAVTGCDGVYHVASPVPVIQPKNPDEVVVPAREGTLNLLGAAREASIPRVVLTSSTASVFSNSRESGVFTGSDWTDLTKKDLSPYIRSKTVAERAAWDFVEGGGPELAVVNPGLVMGPALESDYGSSLEVLVKLLRGDFPFLPRLGFECVDVRDVASLHRLALETPEANGQRFLCANGFWWLKDIAQALKADFPAFRISSREMPDFLVRVASLFIKEIEQFADDVGRVKKVDNAPARSIGWQPRDIEVAIRDGAQSLIDLGIVKAG